MAFLILEFILVAILGRVAEWIIDPVATFQWAQRPPMGHAFVPFYLWISVRLYMWFVRKESPARKKLFHIAFAYKLVFTWLMTWLLVNVYAYGDFTPYYTFPYWASDYIRANDWEAIKDIEVVSSFFFRRYDLNSTTIISYIFTSIFVIMPRSLYGLAFLSGTVVFIATMKLYQVLEPKIEYKRIFFLFFFFSPSITLQLGYTGKETVILPLITAFILYAWKSPKVTGALLALGAIYYVRFYQAFFLMVSWIGSRITLKQMFTGRGLPVMVIAMAAGVLMFRVASNLLGRFGFEIGWGFFEALGQLLSIQHQHGALVLKPFPMPFTFLQGFRPLPWEAHNILALATSLEMFVILCAAIYLLATRYRILWERFHYDKFFRFLALYVFVQFLIFSHIDNMGDLVRRKIYFIPLFVALLCYAKMKAEDVLAAKAERAEKEAGVKRRREPPAPATTAGSVSPPSPG